jgi:hypothetical protein
VSRYIGCEQARELLDGFIDEELGVDEQVLVESHLRWCRTCAARVDDLRLIGASIRRGAAVQEPADDDLRALAARHAGVLTRIRAEHDMSLAVRWREMFVDMRLLWPAIGATTALVIGVAVAFSVLRSAAQESPESLAAMISTLSQPGSEAYPLTPDNGVRSVNAGLQQYVDENRPSAGISLPRSLDDGSVLEGFGHEDAVFALSTVVSRDGRIANYQLLSEQGSRGGRGAGKDVKHPDAVDAMLADAVRHSRFAPAQTPGGSKVAVNMVWLIVTTTAEVPRAIITTAPATPAPARAVPPAALPEVEQSSTDLVSATA